jgi:hypothetical protein
MLRQEEDRHRCGPLQGKRSLLFWKAAGCDIHFLYLFTKPPEKNGEDGVLT